MSANAIAAILAGGRAKRLGGRVKSLIEVDGQAILDRQLAVLRPLVGSVVISANRAEPFEPWGLTVVPDAAPGGGPLVGLAAVLGATDAPWVLVVAGDMPHLSADLIALLLARRSDDVDLVVPFVGELPEPTLAVYSRRCLPVIEERLAARRFRASWLATGGALRVARVDEDELRAVDPELASLTNVNTPADLG